LVADPKGREGRTLDGFRDGHDDGAQRAFSMKKVIFCLTCFAVLPFASCSHSDNSADRKSEIGRGTFVSTNGEAVTAVYSDNATVRLLFPDKSEVELFRATSGSGTRYTNGAAQWWEHQGEGSFNRGGTNIFRGKIVISK
jgi:membrane-bound inhibitor of C-type lysozyme